MPALQSGQCGRTPGNDAFPRERPKGLRTGKKFFAVWWHEKLVTKLPAARLTRLVSDGRAEPFEPMEGRPMNGWVVVAPSVDWLPLIGEARDYVQSHQP